MRESVIISAVRLPTGKFLGALKGFTAPELGAMVVREAVRRAGVDAAAVDECIMGNVVSAGLGQNPARQAALARRPGRSRGRADHQQGLRLGAQGGDARRPGHRHRRHRHRRGGRHGVDEQLPVPAAARARRAADGRRPDRRLDDPRRALVRLRERPHGPVGRGGRRAVTACRARPRTPTPPRATARPRAPRARAGSRTRSCRSPSRSGRATRSCSTATRASARTRPSRALAKLKPAFKKDGTVTAGNAPGVNDGAAARGDHGGRAGRARSG